MTNRRQFLGFGAAASLMPLAAPAFVLAPAPSRIYKVIHDRRIPASAAFAAAMHDRGVPVHEIDGDVTSLWFNDLAPRWRETPVAIAGLTAPAVSFCLEQLAWDHRMRTVFRAERVAGRGGHFSHAVEAPEPVLARLSARGIGVADLAALAMESPHAALGTSRRGTARLPARAEEAPWPGVSWVIAPVRRSPRAGTSRWWGT